MRRFFVDPGNIVGDVAVLDGSEARHIATVLRLATGTIITLFDGSGTYYEALLTKISPSRAETKIVSIVPYIDAGQAPHSSLHLGIGLLKGSKMDLVIQKITELGADSLHPFMSRYCAAQNEPGNRMKRWQKIAHEACKQCNRPKPPALHPSRNFSDMIRDCQYEHDLKLIFWEEEGQQTLAEILTPLRPEKSAFVLVGPEGGFSTDEIELAKEAGFQAVTLGSRILRAETAAIAAVAILQHELGNLA